MSWSEKIGRLRDRELPTVVVTISLDKGAENQLIEAQDGLQKARDAAWLTHDTEDAVENTPEVVEARGKWEQAKTEVKNSAMLLRFKTLPADVMERIRSEVSQTEDEEQRLEILFRKILAASYIPEGDNDDLTEGDVEDLRGVLTDAEWRALQTAVFQNSQQSKLAWELEKKE